MSVGECCRGPGESCVVLCDREKMKYTHWASVILIYYPRLSAGYAPGLGGKGKFGKQVIYFQPGGMQCYWCSTYRGEAAGAYNGGGENHRWAWGGITTETIELVVPAQQQVLKVGVSPPSNAKAGQPSPFSKTCRHWTTADMVWLEKRRTDRVLLHAGYASWQVM